MLSIIIPSYNEPYLIDTIKNILESATGKIEILVNIDDGKLITEIKDPRVKFTYQKSPLGMRGGINLGLKKAKGKYIMKTDAHCVFEKGFDTEIIRNMEDDWLVVPRRYSLYADGWKRDLRFAPKDYHYLTYPIASGLFGKAMFPIEWKQRARDKKDQMIDDTMTIQGSCYIANRQYFMKKVGFLDDNPNTYSPFGGEQMEVGLKYWLGGGKVKVNKNTWYAHLFKNSRYYREVGGNTARKHKLAMQSKGGWKWATNHWMNNQEPNMIHPFSWLIEKFWPVPTWPEDKKLWRYIANNK